MAKTTDSAVSGQRSVCKNCENAEKGTVLVKQILKKKNQRYFLGLL